MGGASSVDAGGRASGTVGDQGGEFPFNLSLQPIHIDLMSVYFNLLNFLLLRKFFCIS